MATSTAPPDSLFVIRVTNNDRWSTATPTEVLAGSNALSLSVDVKGEAVYWIHRESKVCEGWGVVGERCVCVCV